MRVDQIIDDMLDATDIPHEYRLYKRDRTPILPYVVYYIDSEDFGGSDAVSLYKTSSVTLELYTTKKDFELESELESAILKYHWHKVEDYIDGDEIFRIRYSTDITTKL